MARKVTYFFDRSLFSVVEFPKDFGNPQAYEMNFAMSVGLPVI